MRIVYINGEDSGWLSRTEEGCKPIYRLTHIVKDKDYQYDLLYKTYTLRIYYVCQLYLIVYSVSLV